MACCGSYFTCVFFFSAPKYGTSPQRSVMTENMYAFRIRAVANWLLFEPNWATDTFVASSVL